jgi:transglutaminase-like putative cysteine protease
MRKLFSILLTLLLLIFLFPTDANASTNFSTDYRVTYFIAEPGTAHAVLNITLTNTTTQYYASQYRVQLGFDTITNVKITDPDGPIKPVITKTADGQYIDVMFNKKAVGKDSKLPFTIEFDTPNIVQKYGKVWEITIPGIADPNAFNNFTVEVKTPNSFGKPAYIKPKQATDSLVFTKEQLGKSGISIAFGSEQIYAFHLTYHLKNKNVYNSEAEIALPPSTSYQKVFLTSITPQPDTVIEDTDGNWLAKYNLLPTQQLDVVVDGKASVMLTPHEQPLSQADRAAYLEEDQYWPAKSDHIRELADELGTPEAIYNFVTSTLQYDFSRITKDQPAGWQDQPRLGASEALKQKKSATSREFTDLFITLARAAKIPAREINGFAYSENSKQRPLSLAKDILHSWPEYYDDKKKTWVMVDPTWGSTTGGIDYLSVLDFDHLAFAVKGRDSMYPIPAGGYKLANSKGTKDVQITFAQTVPDEEPFLKATAKFPDVEIAGLPIKGEIILKNTSSTEFPPRVIQVSSPFLLPHNQTLASPNIPPFGSATIKLNFNPTSFLTNTKAPFTIHIAEKTIDQTIHIAPFFLTTNGGGILIGIFAFIILIIALKSRRLRLSRRK